MPDNFVSYARFTALPANISEHGAALEELKMLRGRPEPNPALAPMAVPRRSRRLLSLEPAGSDDMRLGEPDEPSIDPYEGPRSTLALSRASAKKLSAGVLDGLIAIVRDMQQDEPRSAMLDSFERVAAMLHELGERNAMTETIYASCLAASRG